MRASGKTRRHVKGRMLQDMGARLDRVNTGDRRNEQRLIDAPLPFYGALPGRPAVVCHSSLKSFRHSDFFAIPRTENGATTVISRTGISQKMRLRHVSLFQYGQRMIRMMRLCANYDASGIGRQRRLLTRMGNRDFGSTPCLPAAPQRIRENPRSSVAQLSFFLFVQNRPSGTASFRGREF